MRAGQPVRLQLSAGLGTSTGGAGSDPATLDTVGRSLNAIHDWTFLLGPGFVVGIGNGRLLAT
jgi:hypothetical protein